MSEERLAVVCPKCGAVNGTESRHCSRCGKALVKKPWPRWPAVAAVVLGVAAFVGMGAGGDAWIYALMSAAFWWLLFFVAALVFNLR